MKRNTELLERYQRLVMLSKSMQALASAGEWDRLIECEVDYLQCVQQLTLTPLTQSLPTTVQCQIRSYIKQVLDNETQLKTLLHGRMNQLRTMSDSSDHQRNINNTYGKMSGDILFPNEL